MSRPEAAHACDYCGLPLDFDARATPPADDRGVGDDRFVEARYCCYGCRFAASVTQARGEVGESRGLMTRLGLAVFFSMNVMAFTMFLWTQDEQTQAADRAAAVFYDVGRYVCLLFSAPVLILLGGPLVEDAWSELRRGRPSTSGLLALGVLAAFLYSVASVYRGQGHVYFEVSCMVLVAVTLGRWLEAHGKLKTTAALRALQSLLPEHVRMLRDGVERQVARREIVPGDRLRVLAGERIPADGCVARGCAAVDQQAVTGESSPIVKEVGDVVYSGTLDLDGELVIEATAAADAGTLEKIIEAVSRAAASRDRYQRLASRVSSWFLPLVIVVAAGTLIWHWRAHDLGHALLASLAVVVIACPCALGLATPMALWASIGRAARGHVLLQDGDALARLAEARVFCFDKTGTLTTGEARVREVVPTHAANAREVLAAAAALTDASTHPLSRALSEHARGLNLRWPAADGVRTLPGRGLAGRVDGEWGDVWVGSPRLLREQAGVTLSDTTREIATHDRVSPGVGVGVGDGDGDGDAVEAGPEVHVAWQGQWRGVVRFDEQLRAGAVETIRWLAAQGREVYVLTGDRRARAASLSEELGVTVEGELLPQDKQQRVEQLCSASGARRGRVVMIGDGINDAPALAAADVGIALGCGTDISRHTAAVCLLGDDLTSLQWLLPLAEETVRTVRWNLIWAFSYNAIGIAAAASGWLNPILAAVAMALSSLLVVTNSLRLGRSATESGA